MPVAILILDEAALSSLICIAETASLAIKLR